MPKWTVRLLVCLTCIGLTILVGCSNPTPAAPTATLTVPAATNTGAATATRAATSAATQAATQAAGGVPACSVLVKNALQAIGERCNAVGNNQACYGNTSINATTANDKPFQAPGDLVNLADLKTLRTTPLDPQKGTWGVAVIKARVNLPGTTAGQQVTFLMYGDTTIDSLSEDMTTVSFRTNVGPLACDEAPPSGLVVQVPKGQKIKFTANGVEINLASTIVMDAQPDRQMSIYTVQGQANVSVGGVAHDVPAGFYVDVPLKGAQASGPPSEPKVIPLREVSAAPVQVLAEPITQQEIARVVQVAATQVVLTSTVRPTQPTSTPGTPLPTITPLLTWTPGPTLAPVSGARNRIVYATNKDGNWEIYLMNADGTSPQRLTNRAGDDKSPTWSPDGRHIAWASYNGTLWQIFTMDDNAGNPHLLTPDGLSADHPTWSPDGSLIVFDGLKDNNRDIYVIGADGSNLQALASHPADDSMPAWSPDGKRIAFVSMRDGNKEIYVMDASGANVMRLTNNPADDIEPSWSPDGKRIAFVSSRGGSRQIYTMNADGSNPRRLISSPANDEWPTWSPEGTQIAFVSDREGARAIYIVSVNSGDSGTPSGSTAATAAPTVQPPRRLTDLSADTDNPIWQR